MPAPARSLVHDCSPKQLVYSDDVMVTSWLIPANGGGDGSEGERRSSWNSSGMRCSAHSSDSASKLSCSAL